MKRRLDIIAEIERAIDVNGILCRGIQVWPFVRALLHRCSVHPEISDKVQANLNVRRGVRVIPDAGQLAEFERLGDIDILFFSRRADHDRFIDGKCYSSTMDPYFEKVSGRYRCLKIELLTRDIEATMPRRHETIFLKHGMPEYEYPNDEEMIKRLDPVRKLLAEIGFDLANYYGILQRDLQRSEQFYLFYKDILKRIRPRAVAQVAYGYPGGMGMVRACYEMGIETIEIQHGVMCGHVLYENWGRVPQGGYPVVPKWFFVWGRNFKEGIERGSRPGSNYHRAVVCGNQHIKTQGKGVCSEPGRAFIDQIGSMGRRILLTLGIQDSLPGHVVEAMVKSDSDWIWLVRAHPNHRDAAEKIRMQLDGVGIKNYEFEKSGSLPLHKLLEVSDYHVTDYSNTAFDALRFGVRTLFYLEHAYNYFADYIERGLFELEHFSADRLLDHVSKVWDKEVVRSRAEGFYDPDESKCIEAFNMILSGAGGVKFREFDHRTVHQNRLGVAFWQQGESDKAASCFMEAVKMNPDDLQAYNQLAGLYWQSGRPEMTGHWLREALKRNPCDAQSRQSWELFCRYCGMSKSNDITNEVMR